MKTDISSSLTAALSGLQVGVNRARAASGEISKLTTESDSVRDTVRPLLALQQAETEVATSTKVVKAENDTLGRFVDETA
ncbi:MAG: hypothetical protein OQK58_05885 [Gammaproteobacteria bacterium]|nr:hypothetical protein [Gammaproteobacteria bacterium]